jgi:hypothetical protein
MKTRLIEHKLPSHENLPKLSHPDRANTEQPNSLVRCVAT